MIGRPLSGRSLGGRKLSGYGFSTHGGGGGGSASSVPRIVMSLQTFAEDAGPVLSLAYVTNKAPGAEYEIEIVESDPPNLFALDGENFEVTTNLDYETAPNPTVTMRFRQITPEEGEWSEPEVFPLNVTNVIELPDAFEVGDWDADPGEEQTDITINSLPADNGGGAISDIEYRVDGGSWVSTGGTSSFSITGLTNDTEYDVELRAVNSDGAGAASDVKSVTPGEANTLIVDLVVAQEFEEASGTRVDSHGSFDLTDNNTVGSTTGVVGNAADFIAANTESLSHASHDDLALITSKTFILWAQADMGGDGDGQVAFAKGNHTGSQEYVLRRSGGNNWSLELSSDGSTRTTISRTALISSYHFLAITYDISTGAMAFSVDDGTPGTATLSGTPVNRGQVFRIGAWSNSIAPFDGKIDQFFMWNRVLTSEEITWLYNSGSGRSYAEVSAGM